MTKEVYIKSKDGTDKQGKQPDKVELGMLEEDDEFEEFAAHPMSGDPKKAEEITVWEDNWDDDIVDDEFTHQLRAEFQKQGKAFVVPEIFPGAD
ncbi:26S proteasome complex subunit [Clonorchis sinensis]|uniref:26S proteasome complex subunit SEM1 n=1 Tax=Clonorchis sinensis TaxID=79923 RepID=A0A8T1MUD0_CLOSI|nr:26S proteasome complex subunit [Clonorchis sinensis]